MNKDLSVYKVIGIVTCVVIAFVVFIGIVTSGDDDYSKYDSNSLKILSSYENRFLEDKIEDYAIENDMYVDFEYMGDLDIVSELNTNADEYDAVWISNSMWLYMLNNTYLTSESKSISVSPVVVGLKKSKAEKLGLVNKNITNDDILELIQKKKIKYVMSSVTKTNTGATAYFGFLNSLAGNPEVFTSDMLKDEKLISDLSDVFSGVERVSGDEDYLEEMFLKSDEYEAVIADESSLININKSLKKDGKEQLYLLYPTDGVAVNDSTFAYIDNQRDKKDTFLKIQSYLLNNEGQKMLKAEGRRTWYGGVSNDVDKNVFNKDWGIDTTKYLNVTRFPSKKVMTDAINLYIERLRKPTHVVFCLDYSGSMYDVGITELRDAMNYILDYNKAKADQLQFSVNDKITVITFSTTVTNVWSTNNGQKTSELISNINKFDVDGSTALYDAVSMGLDILGKESDDYTKTIIAMTDGNINIGTFYNLERKYESLKKDIPVYSITFGSASEDQLEEIADLTNAKVFDGRHDLLSAFKEVRSYN